MEALLRHLVGSQKINEWGSLFVIIGRATFSAKMSKIIRSVVFARHSVRACAAAFPRVQGPGTGLEPRGLTSRRDDRHDSRRGFVVAVVELQMGFGVAHRDVKRRTYRQGGPDGGQGGDRERSSMGPRRLAILSSRSGPPENLSWRHSERWLRMPPIGALETCRVRI